MLSKRNEMAADLLDRWFSRSQETERINEWEKSELSLYLWPKINGNNKKEKKSAIKNKEIIIADREKSSSIIDQEQKTR